MTQKQVAPEDCPEPYWHRTHYYCPACSWVSPDAPKSEVEQLREKVSAFLDEVDTGTNEALQGWVVENVRAILRGEA